MIETSKALKIARNFLSGDPWIAPTKEELAEALETLVLIVSSLDCQVPRELQNLDSKLVDPETLNRLATGRDTIAVGVDTAGNVITKECWHV